MQYWKLWIFLLQFWNFYGILWSNLFKILDLDTKKLFTHFCFLNFWFWKKNNFADFFGAIGYQKNLQFFKKKLKKWWKFTRKYLEQRNWWFRWWCRHTRWREKHRGQGSTGSCSYSKYRNNHSSSLFLLNLSRIS